MFEGGFGAGLNEGGHHASPGFGQSQPFLEGRLLLIGRGLQVALQPEAEGGHLGRFVLRRRRRDCGNADRRGALRGGRFGRGFGSRGRRRVRRDLNGRSAWRWDRGVKNARDVKREKDGQGGETQRDPTGTKQEGEYVHGRAGLT